LNESKEVFDDWNDEGEGCCDHITELGNAFCQAFNLVLSIATFTNDGGDDCLTNGFLGFISSNLDFV